MMPTADIVKAVRSVVGPGKIELHEPMETVWSCSKPTSYDELDRFQAKIAEVCGVEQALCVSTGTAAIHLALMLVGVEQHTEVLVPALNFVAAANAVCYCGAIPNFVDVRSYDFGINPFKLGRYLERICEKRITGTYNRMTGRRLTALIAVDLYGVPAAIDEILDIAGRWGIPVIEDAAEALGSVYRGSPCGSMARFGIISFNSNKIVTTNGGGALLTNDPFMQAQAWELATTARLAHPWAMGNHTRVAYNYRMGNINAAYGLPQLELLHELVGLKTRLHRAYLAAGLKLFDWVGQVDGSICNHWLNILELDPLDHRRDEICAALHAEGIACRTIFTPLNELPMFKTNPRDNLEAAQEIWRRCICLPSSPALGEKFK